MRSHKGGKSTEFDPKIAEMMKQMGLPPQPSQMGGNSPSTQVDPKIAEMMKQMGLPPQPSQMGGNESAHMSPKIAEMMKQMGQPNQMGGNESAHMSPKIAEMMKKMDQPNQMGGNESAHMSPKIAEMMKKMDQPNQMGGSPASSIVMSSYDSPVMNDYVIDPRVRSNDDTAGCQLGGSTASDMVTSQLNDVSQTVNYPEGYKVDGDINSLNLYAPSGGAKKHKKRGNKQRSNKKSAKRNSKKRNSKKNNSKKNNNMNKMRGGHASDWISSQYSLGDINGNAMNSNTNDFSSSQGVSRDILMNPPTLGLAGSGYPMSQLEGANVQSVGAPLV
jgi:hypothetical protein